MHLLYIYTYIDIDAYIKPNSFHVQIYNPVLWIVHCVICSLSNTRGVRINAFVQMHPNKVINEAGDEETVETAGSTSSDRTPPRDELKQCILSGFSWR